MPRNDLLFVPSNSPWASPNPIIFKRSFAKNYVQQTKVKLNKSKASHLKRQRNESSATATPTEPQRWLPGCLLQQHSCRAKTASRGCKFDRVPSQKVLATQTKCTTLTHVHANNTHRPHTSHTCTPFRALRAARRTSP